MSAPPPSPLAERFARLIDGLCRAVAARGGRDTNRIEMPLAVLPAPLVVFIWRRLRRVGVAFSALAARIQAGTPPTRRAARRAAPAEPLSPPPERQAPIYPAPRGIGWLSRLVPEARPAAAQLRALLAEPDMAALLVEYPPLHRAIRPLCRMLGITPPPPRTAPLEPPPAKPRQRAARNAAPALPTPPLDRWRLRPQPAPNDRPRPRGHGPPVPA